ncbi:MAG TPA: hypothetical protein V6C97_04275 [Oculatellaceae cyanobacterium]
MIRTLLILSATVVLIAALAFPVQSSNAERGDLAKSVGKTVTVTGTFRGWGPDICVNQDPRSWIHIEPWVVGPGDRVVQVFTYMGVRGANEINDWSVQTKNRKEMTNSEAAPLIEKLNYHSLKEGELVTATGRLCHFTAVRRKHGSLQCPVPHAGFDSYYFFCVGEVVISPATAGQSAGNIGPGASQQPK